MQISIDELLRGKGTVIKNNEYLSTEQYVEPFLNAMSKYTNNFVAQALTPKQMSLNMGAVKTEDKIYNRVWVQAILPGEYCFDEHSQVVGLVYGIDIRRPVVKIYVGAVNNACLNLCIFEPEFLNVQFLEPNQYIDFSCIERLMNQRTNMKEWLRNMHDTMIPYDYNIIEQTLGRWVRNAIEECIYSNYGKIKFAAGSVVDAFKMMYYDKDSAYYVPEGDYNDMFNVYNAFTQLITNDQRDILNKAEKTLLLQRIIGVGKYQS